MVEGHTPARLTFGPLEVVELPAALEVPVAAAALLDDDDEAPLLPQAVTASAAAVATAAKAVNRIRLCILFLCRVMSELV